MSSRKKITKKKIVPPTGTTQIDVYKECYQERKKLFPNKTPKRYEMLYQNSQKLREKSKRDREQSINDRIKNEMEKCTFEPNLNKDYKYVPNIKPYYDPNSPKKQLEKSSASQVDQTVVNLLNRQEKWLDNRNIKNQKRKEQIDMKEKQDCFFVPVIEFDTENGLTNLKNKSFRIVQHPEAYLNFIERNKESRERRRNNLIKIFPLTGDGKSSHTRNKSVNRYDYREHELSKSRMFPLYKSLLIDDSKNKERSFSQGSSRTTNFIRARNKSTEITLHNSIRRIKEVDDNVLFEMIYRQRKQEELYDIEDAFEKDMANDVFNWKNRMQFNKALDCIHNKLINMKLLEDEYDEFNGSSIKDVEKQLFVMDNDITK